MPEHTLNLPVCAHCDGFPTVAITTGQTNADGHRETVTATCRPCNGTGHTAPARAYARTGA
ncbi:MULTISPECIES: hypothetical protein [unclassified Streptomyces]|uniref:hypothetical protein n=1 Tax=unclassified Streptomyces TaxID=2593676 RepID=UPI00324E56FC